MMQKTLTLNNKHGRYDADPAHVSALMAVGDVTVLRRWLKAMLENDSHDTDTWVETAMVIASEWRYLMVDDVQREQLLLELAETRSVMFPF